MSDPIATSEPTAAPSSGGKVEQAKNVAGDAVDRAHDVAGQASAEAKEVARDARAQLQDLIGRTRQNVDQEARTRSRQAAGSLRSLAEQLGALANGDTGGAGPLADYARQGRERMAQLADRLDDGPSAVLDDVRRFARRQPVLFLAAAGAVGFAAGRMLRAGKEAVSDSQDTSVTPGGTGWQVGQGEPNPLTAPAPAPAPEAIVAPDIPPVGVTGTTATAQDLAR